MVVSINDQTRIEIYVVWYCSNQSARTSTCTLLIINQNYRDQLIYHDEIYTVLRYNNLYTQTSICTFLINNQLQIHNTYNSNSMKIILIMMKIWTLKQYPLSPTNMNKTNALICTIINSMVVSINDQTWIEIYVVLCYSKQEDKNEYCFVM